MNSKPAVTCGAPFLCTRSQLPFSRTKDGSSPCPPPLQPPVSVLRLKHLSQEKTYHSNIASRVYCCPDLLHAFPEKQLQVMHASCCPSPRPLVMVSFSRAGTVAEEICNRTFINTSLAPVLSQCRARDCNLKMNQTQGGPQRS